MPASRHLTAGTLALLHDPDHYTRPFPRRHDSALPFDPAALPAGVPLMLDHGLCASAAKQDPAIDPRLGRGAAGAPLRGRSRRDCHQRRHHGPNACNDPALPYAAIWPAARDQRLGHARAGSRRMGRDRHAGGHFGAYPIQPGATQNHARTSAMEQQRECRRRLLNDARIFLCAGECGAARKCVHTMQNDSDISDRVWAAMTNAVHARAVP